jgi:threonine dehydrogenase-like Zn-dependent dehydrogenase
LPPELIAALVGNGPLGIIAALAIWGYVKKDIALREAQDRRMDDLKEYAQQQLQESRRVTEQMAQNTQAMDRALAVMEATSRG